MASRARLAALAALASTSAAHAHSSERRLPLDERRLPLDGYDPWEHDVVAPPCETDSFGHYGSDTGAPVPVEFYFQVNVVEEGVEEKDVDEKLEGMQKEMSDLVLPELCNDRRRAERRELGLNGVRGGIEEEVLQVECTGDSSLTGDATLTDSPTSYPAKGGLTLYYDSVEGANEAKNAVLTAIEQAFEDGHFDGEGLEFEFVGTEIEHAGGCKVGEDGTFGDTTGGGGEDLPVEYYYEVIVEEGVNILTLVPAIETGLADGALSEMAAEECAFVETERRLMLEADNRRRLRSVWPTCTLPENVKGVSSDPPDEVVTEDGTSLTDGGTPLACITEYDPATQDCYVVKGETAVYVEDNLAAEEKESIATSVLTGVETTLDSDSLEAELSDEGVVAIEYTEASDYNPEDDPDPQTRSNPTTTIRDDSGGGGGVNAGVIAGAVAGGLLAAGVMLYAAAKRRKKDDEEEEEEGGSSNDSFEDESEQDV